ncbi:MAG: CvpA family protein [Candidatus Dormibacteria bacterium]
MADLVIVAIFALAIYLGLRRGLVGPLVGEFAFFLALALTARFHGLGDHLLPNLPTFVVSALMVTVISLLLGLLATPVVAALRAVPLVRPVDKFAGVAVHSLVAFVAIYLFIGAVIDFDRYVRPVLQTGVITARQVQDYRTALEANPLARPYVNEAQLNQAQQLANRQPLPVAAFDKLDQFLSFYRDHVREPLLHSRLAPIINSAGAALPLVGHKRAYLAPVKESN